MFLKTYRQTKRLYNKKFVIPIMRSQKSLKEVALGVQIGLFWAFTPTIGLQIYIVLLQWVIQKYILQRKFDVTIALTLIWISNPITIVPLYLLFYNTGVFLFKVFKIPLTEVVFSDVIYNLNSIFSASKLNFMEKLFDLLAFLFNSWGIVLFAGAIVYAVPISILGYFFTKRILLVLKEKRNTRKKHL